MNTLQNWHKWALLSLLGLALSARTIGCDYSSITEKFGAEAVARCNEKCPFQNRTGEGQFDVSCGSDCSVQQCKLGCSLWQEGLENSCQIVCNVTQEVVFSRELYCFMGCNEALNSYFQNLRELIGTPTAPALVADSLTATSLSLVWEAPNLGNLSYMVQWRYEELPGTWQYYSNSSHSDQSIIHVDGLRPYTKYRFRVAIFLSGRGGTGEPLYSAPSVVISTLESGKPSSAPKSLRAAAPDPSRIAISWEPGPFPNGPVISYVLRLIDTQPNKSAAVEDMPSSNNTLFYMFQNLAPDCEYQVSVAMRNAVGEGPSASEKISTPPLLTRLRSTQWIQVLSPPNHFKANNNIVFQGYSNIPAGPTQQPVLILGGEQNILAAPANDMLSDPIELYSTEHSITGVGIDISSDSLFVSVSNGYIYRSLLSKKSASVPILTPESISYKPQDLSVDWLNRHLYVLGEVYYAKEGSSYWEIIRYDFHGKNELVAKSGFNSRPIHFEVDPYNGYLFWAQQGGDRGGLYRLDLANISNGVRYGAHPEIIVRDAELGAFTVDHADFRILVAHLKRNTVWAVSLDGREVTDFRNNTQTPMFRSTRSIAYAGGLFYWTNGKEMLTEEYHAQSDSYFHNEYPLDFNSKSMATKEVLVKLRSCQPIPVPVNPPLGLQSVMGMNRAKISWFSPHLLGHQGSGAWQKWTYHLQLTNMATGKIIDIKNINDTTCTVENLDQLTEYTIRVAAVTESGSGPWSSIFVGTTLSSSANNLNSTLLWSGPDGLMQTDLTGENLQMLIHRDELKNSHIIDISWYRDKLYLVTNSSTVIWYNITTHRKGLMLNMENVGSLAVDWVGKKIYWSNPKQQLITRGNLDGGDREPLPIVTVAKELTIDSLGAYIYWNTGHAVEAARLNGENKKVYYPAQLFSGKQVMGLTTDLEKKLLYWLVRSYDGSELHVAPTADQITLEISGISSSLVTRISGTATLGPLCYFSNRLVWVQDGMKAIVSDLNGKNTAELVPRVNAVAVRDPSLHAESELFTAIPETINSSSITVNGEWDRFNVTWDPATRVNINNSRVYYDVNLIFYGQYKIEKTVDVNWIEVRERTIGPYSTMEATVRAHTHWGGGAAARALLHSPQAPPSAPRAPRIYVQPAVSGGPLTAIFRWGNPARANGVIRGYEAQCWVVAHSSTAAKRSACANANLPPLHTQLMLTDLSPASEYFFQVRAFTDAGFGQYSEVVSASSDELNPIPKVMISSQESIKIIDLDAGESEMIPKSTGIPVDFAVSTEENIVYWVNNLEEIFSSRINSSGHFKLLSINGTATSMCFDWVSRSIYWSQSEFTLNEPYVIYRADLGFPNTRPQISHVLARKQPIDSLQIIPMHGLLLWYEESVHPGLGTIMSSQVNGSNIKSFFKGSSRDCNCPENPQVAKPFIIDMTKNNSYELYWIDPWVNHIIASDLDACKCRIVVDATEKKKYGFTPMSIAVDSRYVYWFNSTRKEIFYTTKYHKSRVEERKTAYGYKIMALDPGSQPYPPRQCLLPKLRHLKPKVISNTANSVNLRMPSVSKLDHCNHLEYEMPMTEFTIFYRSQTKGDSTFCDKESCPYIKTTNTEIIMTDLKPFTNYSILLEATNYYAKLHEYKPIVGVPMTIQTAAEAPTAPKDVKGRVLSPVLAQVEWKPVPGLWYEVHWQTDDSPSPAHKLKEHITFEVSEGRSVNLTRLSPNTTYNVRVRARSKHSAAGPDSPPLRLRTYPLPAALSLKNVTPYEIQVSWLPPTTVVLHDFKVEYTEVITSVGLWKSCSRYERDLWAAKELRPKTRYRFRLRLQYVPNAPPYFWPHDDRFTYETLGDVPGAPGSLRVEGVGERMLRVWWTEPDPRGSPVTNYRVWGRPKHRVVQGSNNITRNISEMLPLNLPSDIDDEMKMNIAREGLELLHNGTDTYWLVSDGSVGSGWVAQVQARNAHGWGELSAASELDAAALAPHRPPAAALALALLALLALLLAVAAGVFYAYNTRARKKAALENQIISNVPRRGPDVELATLRQLPTRHSTNILYNQGVHCPTDAELAGLPHIRREQITLTKFLGSGAFGEVFEGVARQINGSTADTKVAVKTLRKSATEQEKTEFLKEAALMSNFKHEHILRLLGVCLDNDPNYIIMELMEGGDLLSYLRAKRVSLYTPESLTLLDLLNMCVDVTKGCRYLEEMHFVHRDLACRNCLVAHRANGRVVKIGDFGLARDIYKNDYYRKEGEGLLPVRWMAVECLVDGVFTCQSDVWAWGVLCWEVLSLGQQPYPARTNRQVLAYVRAGGTPDRPPNCPSVFYDLLQKCWSYSAETRPSFRHCLEVVTALRDKTSPNITLTATATPAPHYLTLLGDENKLTNTFRMAACSDAVDNRTYLLDENDNACLDEDFPEHQMEPSRLLPERNPKYLELMYDSDSAQGTVCDGYEIPRTPLMTPFSRHSIVGVAPNRLIKPPLYRTHSLRTHTRPPNATIIPLRNGIVKRASLCDEMTLREPRALSSRNQSRVDLEFDKHVFKTPF